MSKLYNVKFTSFTALKLSFFNIPNTILHFLSWGGFKNSFDVEIVLLHAQPLAKSHSHFLIAVDSATYQVVLQC
jgi:hypothetical protein